MSRNYILVDGVPTPEPDVVKWATWYERADRHVGSDQVGQMHVSTVFLGIDHDFFGHGRPILWETIIFYAPDGDDHQERYTSREDAVVGHQRAVEVAKALDAIPPRIPTQPGEPQ
jgi:hypothetical protein